jgi:hypothetical protein
VTVIAVDHASFRLEGTAMSPRRTPRLVTVVSGATLLLLTTVACSSESAPAGGAAAPGAAAPGAAPGAATRIVGLTDDNKLVEFTSADTAVRETGTISGLAGDTRLVGIDYRVQDGNLYGVGDQGGLYTLEPAGQATSVGRLSVPLQGASFGVDFNPAANALRVVSDTGQNLRQSFAATPLAATVTDTALAYPPAPPATPAATTPTGIMAAAYTNNDTDANTGTSLFDLDSATDQVVLQSPANGGLLAATGKLGVDAGTDGGFDIHTAGADQVGYATLSVGGQYGLYRVALLSGTAESIGSLGRNVVDLAIPLS